MQGEGNLEVGNYMYVLLVQHEHSILVQKICFLCITSSAFARTCILSCFMFSRFYPRELARILMRIHRWKLPPGFMIETKQFYFLYELLQT